MRKRLRVLLTLLYRSPDQIPCRATRTVRFWLFAASATEVCRSVLCLSAWCGDAVAYSSIPACFNLYRAFAGGWNGRVSVGVRRCGMLFCSMPAITALVCRAGFWGRRRTRTLDSDADDYRRATGMPLDVRQTVA